MLFNKTKNKKENKKPQIMNLRFLHPTDGIIVIPNIIKMEEIIPIKSYFLQYLDNTTEILIGYELLESNMEV